MSLKDEKREKAKDLIELALNDGTTAEERSAAAYRAIKIVHKYKLLDPTPLDRPTHAIIVSLRGDLVGLLVDEVNDVIAVESQDILPAPANLAGLEGHFFEAVARTNDGLIAVLDMNRIAGAAMAQSSSPN